jgi:hypothetical protein
MEYYEERTRRLNALQEGYVRFRFVHCSTEEGGVLIIGLEDSGRGFDFDGRQRLTMTRGDYSGRGLPLVASLTDSLEFKNAGNEVEATYIWQYD